MKIECHYFAVAMTVGWLLLQPPTRPVPAPPGSPSGTEINVEDRTAPFSRWTIIKTFPTEKACRAQVNNTLVGVRSHVHGGFAVAAPAEFVKLADLQCVAADDPRLKIE